MNESAHLFGIDAQAVSADHGARPGQIVELRGKFLVVSMNSQELGVHTILTSQGPFEIVPFKEEEIKPNKFILGAMVTSSKFGQGEIVATELDDKGQVIKIRIRQGKRPGAFDGWFDPKDCMVMVPQ